MEKRKSDDGGREGKKVEEGEWSARRTEERVGEKEKEDAGARKKEVDRKRAALVLAWLSPAARPFPLLNAIQREPPIRRDKTLRSTVTSSGMQLLARASTTVLHTYSNTWFKGVYYYLS